MRRVLLVAVAVASEVLVVRGLRNRWSAERTSAPPATSTNGRGTMTKRELSEEAKRLDVPGRSRMAKAELERVFSERTGMAR